jgi:hypothetical protein
MNNKYTKFLFLALAVAAFSSCSTAYKMGQTPDDVYFSPAREQAAGSVASQRQDDSYVGAQQNPNRYQGYNNSNYDDYSDYRNDRFLRMSMGSRMRLSAFDDLYWSGGYNNFGYNGFGYNNYGYSIASPFNSYYYWNSFYNPYNTINFSSPYYGGYGGYGGGYGNVISVNPKNPASSTLRPRAFNPGSYSNNSYNNNNLFLYRNTAPVTRPGTNAYNSGYNNTNSRTTNRNSYYNNTNSGNTNRRQTTGNSYFNNSGNNNSFRNNNSYTPPARSTFSDAPSRSYTPSSSSSGSSSGGGGGVSRPTRGN